MTAGEPGAEFFVIDDGAVDVFDESGLRRREHAGDYFGEIALLRDMSRTATVVAATPVRLVVPDRDEFLAAVGSHAISRHGVQVTIDARLTGDARGGRG